jgi:hypothetical protein
MNTALVLISSLFIAGACSVAVIIFLLTKRTPVSVGRPLDTSAWNTTGITFYGQSAQDDNGLGYTGVDLFKHGRGNITFNGKPVFPAAVFQSDAAPYLYKVIEVTSPEFTNHETVYLHVVDVCNAGQDVCKTNTKKHGFLVDIHATGFSYVGNSDGILEGKVRIVGHIGPNELPPSVWNGEYIICSCTGTCAGDNVTWKKRGTC